MPGRAHPGATTADAPECGRIAGQWSQDLKRASDAERFDWTAP